MIPRTLPQPGFKPRRPATPEVQSPTQTEAGDPDPVEVVAPAIAPKALVPGSITAKALARVWAGGELTVVDSPPGAGKTELVVTIAAHLAVRAGMKVLIGTPTRAQGVSLVARIVEQVTPKRVRCEIPDAKTTASADTKDAAITVATLAKIKFMDRSPYDLLIVDEAYQTTHALFSTAARGLPQAMLVGDPGQIGPVITVDTSIWRGQKDAPHLRAPEVTGEYEDVTRFALDTTWRLGPAGAAAIAPIYPFKFRSGAQHEGEPVRRCVMDGGEILGEIESIEAPHAKSADDLAVLSLVTDRAEALVTSTLVERDGVRSSTPEDVAVICSRNSQVSIISGMLRQRCLSEITVGTADRLQGGQWALVVALDPFVGASNDSEHNASIGRLCVMASRHTTHLSWVHDDSWIDMTAGRTAIAHKNRVVRKSLTSNPITISN